jgi:hypothetical protein
MGPSNTGGSISTEISNQKFTGLFFERIGQLDFRYCLIKGLMRGFMTLETPLNGMFVQTSSLQKIAPFPTASSKHIVSVALKQPYVPNYSHSSNLSSSAVVTLSIT